MSIKVDKQLMEEIIHDLESVTELPLEPIVRKASRLAQSSGEIEFHLLFELHLAGKDTKLLGQRINTLMSSEPSLKWDPRLIWMADRELDSSTATNFPLSQIEYINKHSRAYFGNPSSNPIKADAEIQLLEGTTKVLNKIRNQVWSFVLYIQGKFYEIMENEKQEIAIISANKKVFIGHGKSGIWMYLKDFIQNRLELPCEEFNQEAVAGLTTKERLEEMVSEASFAFLVMTAEDEHIDGSYHARENVIHEIGLFQGKLGFRKAIVLLEDGCSEFSNIVGLTQIRFPKGDILAKSEEMRHVLEREGLISFQK